LNNPAAPPFLAPVKARSARSPWQNGYAERLIGSIRRECLDHVVVLGERHLRHVLLSYMKYYNEMRTHVSLEKDAPVPRAVERAGTSIVGLYWAGCIINMSGFDLRQAQWLFVPLPPACG
jgi:Integrase core domain